MVRNIVRDTVFLAIPSKEAAQSDFAVATDLADTLRANEDRCVGMAANMIGVSKKVIAVSVGPVILILYNPAILNKSDPYDTEEGCLSLSGVRPVTRYGKIEVEYRDASFRKQRQTFRGETAQIIQHEIDHLSGRLI